MSTAKDKRWFGWHFLQADGRLRYGDYRKPRVGRWMKSTGKPVLCENGMHASALALDALNEAPGPIACYVELRGGIEHGSDKSVACERKIIAMADATRVLHEFACWCAKRALDAETKAGRQPDPRIIKAIKVKIRWLKGRATDAELAAARSAARDAAQDAGWATGSAAAWDTAVAATLTTACDTARAAAWNAAWNAVRDTVRDAAWNAAWAAQNKRLTTALRKLLKLTERQK
jgi:hypothetical protein